MVQLQFWECSLDDATVKALAKFKGLKHFHLTGGDPLPEELLPAIAARGSLETLALHGLAPTSKHGVNKLANCSGLEYIDAQCLAVTADDLLTFRGMTELRELEFCGRVALEQVEAMLRDTPKCTVTLCAPKMNVFGFNVSNGPCIRYRWSSGEMESQELTGPAGFGGIR